MANASTIDKYVQHWLITNPIILKINNPDKAGLRLVLSYKNAEIIIRDINDVIPDINGIYKLTLTDDERSLVYRLTTIVADPTINIILRAYSNNTLISEDVKTINVITSNIIWTKINGVWKKAKSHIKLSEWKKGLVWHKDSNNTWSK